MILHCSTVTAEAKEIYASAPAGIKNLKMGSQGVMFKELDLDRENGCIRDIDTLLISKMADWPYYTAILPGMAVL